MGRSNNPVLRVGVVDGYPAARAGLRGFLGAAPGIRPVGEVEDGEAALRLVGEESPDLHVLGYDLFQGPDGVQVCRSIKRAPSRSLLYAVSNTEAAQTVHVTVVLDGPGTAQDATLVDEDVALGPSCPQDGSLCTDATFDRFEFRVKQKDWPADTYSLSVSGSGSETATAVSPFMVAYKK